jgi:mono/diheme cytochrome c family protein
MKFLFGVIVGAVLVVAALAAYFVTGMAPAAVNDPPMPFERLIAGAALHARIARVKAQESPIPADNKNLLAGADEYNMDCAGCHGLPGQQKTDIAAGMYPHPPQLFHGEGVTDDSLWEIYWKVDNGIRLTGMPAFKGMLSDTQIWQLSELLAHANALPDSVKKELAPNAPAPK